MPVSVINSFVKFDGQEKYSVVPVECRKRRFKKINSRPAHSVFEIVKVIIKGHPFSENILYSTLGGQLIKPTIGGANW